MNGISCYNVTIPILLCDFALEHTFPEISIQHFWRAKHSSAYKSVPMVYELIRKAGLVFAVEEG